MSNKESILSLEKLNSERITRLESKVDRILELISTKSSAENLRIWGPIIAAATLLLTIIMFISTGVNARVDWVKERAIDHYNSSSHPEAAKKLASLESSMTSDLREVETQFKNIDERTDRMERASDRERARLDDRLQREMRDRELKVLSELNSIHKDIERLYGYSERRTEKIDPAVAVFKEQIDIIRRDLEMLKRENVNA